MEAEIDLVGVDTKAREALFVECKWADLSEGAAREVLAALKEKAALAFVAAQKTHSGVTGVEKGNQEGVASARDRA